MTLAEEPHAQNFGGFICFFILSSMITQLISSQLELPVILTMSLPHLGSIISVNYLWLLVLIPYLSASVRRLHDIDKSGWNFYGSLSLSLTLFCGSYGIAKKALKALINLAKAQFSTLKTPSTLRFVGGCLSQIS